jgi:hypothetical protein
MTQIKYEGGDGHSIETAIVIMGAKNSIQGVRAENLWVKGKHADWIKLEQVLHYKDGKYYDELVFRTPSGEWENVFFDITHFFGSG